jgi:hypothetical protein
MVFYLFNIGVVLWVYLICLIDVFHCRRGLIITHLWIVVWHIVFLDNLTSIWRLRFRALSIFIVSWSWIETNLNKWLFIIINLKLIITIWLIVFVFNKPFVWAFLLRCCWYFWSSSRLRRTFNISYYLYILRIKILQLTSLLSILLKVRIKLGCKYTLL